MALLKKKLPLSLKHSLWSVLDAALYPVVYLATVPMMIHSMGYINFGFWVVINSLITILQLFNFNSGIASLGVATIRNISMAKTNEDDSYAIDTINTILFITLLLFILVVIIGLGLAYGTTKYQWWGIRDMENTNVFLCVFLTALFSGLKFFDQVFQSIIKAYEYFKWSSILNIFNRFSLLFINLFLAINRYSIAIMLIWNIVFLLLYLIIEFIFVTKALPSYKIRQVKDKRLYKQMLNVSFLTWLQSIIIVCTFQSDRFWVSSYAGLKEVSGYGLVSTMFNHIHIIFTAIALWTFPRIAGMTIKGEDPAKFYLRIRGLLLGFVVISLLSFNFMAPMLMNIWVGKDTAQIMLGYIKSFVAFEIVFAHTILAFFYLNAAGKEKIAALTTLLYCGACYIFMVGALWIFKSPIAMVIGMTLSLCITMPIINSIVHKIMGKSYSLTYTIAEMTPMYAAVALIYFQGNIWLSLALLALVVVLLWKYYLSGILNKRLWQQLPTI